MSVCLFDTRFISYNPSTTTARTTVISLFTMPKSNRIAYFYDSRDAARRHLTSVGDMGNYYYAPGHPMKPQRLRLTHNLLLAYKLYRYLEVYVGVELGALSVETAQSECSGAGGVSHKRVCRLSEQHQSAKHEGLCGSNGQMFPFVSSLTAQSLFRAESITPSSTACSITVVSTAERLSVGSVSSC